MGRVLTALLVLLFGLIQAASVEAQDIARLQAGVVKITATEENKTKVGTGFIVKLESDLAYIVTAAHVLGSDPQPKVEFFTKPSPVRATVVNKEGEEVTSLALLMIQGRDNFPSGITALPIATAVRLSGGEDIVVIGHPRSAGDWTVLKGSIARREGRHVKVDANVDEGSSGGPMLQSGKVVGLVAGTTKYGLAVTASSIREYLDGNRVPLEEEARTAQATSPGSSPTEPETRETIRGREITGQDGPPMVLIPAGEFLMGSPDDVGASYEHPAHKVRFSKPFAIARYETTFEEYDRFAEATGRPLPDDAGFGRGRRPVVNVTWQDAKDYADWLSRKPGKRYRLPTEAEWEYAARSGGQNDIWPGTSDEKQLTAYAVYGENSQKRTAPVGSKKPNRLGLHDMSGNVWEWAEDCSHDSYQEAPEDGTAWEEAGGGDCGWRVVRGGSYHTIPGYLRVSGRLELKPDTRDRGLGFRLVQDLN
jgi:formylglycine-generating enzyme required for sulfatase activity